MTAQNPIPARPGALTTRLTTALQHLRQALAPHDALLGGQALADTDAMLAELARRRVRIALYGEVKAGKSTLLNAIAAAELSPTAFDPLTSIPVRITYGEQTVWKVGERTLGSAAEVAEAMRTQEVLAGEIVVETDLDLLQLGGQVDLVDTPGVGAEERFDAVTAEALRSLDAVILVVRYPGLFTKATRRLMGGLQSDMGKLFVVWNLDQACAELTPAERTAHAETLRANVAGANDLFLVDARAGFEAGRRRDVATVAASGLGPFTAALSRFVSSAGRDLAAVREAAKRAHQLIGVARKSLTARHATLEVAVREAHGRLRAVEATAGADADSERARHQELEAEVTRMAESHRAGAVKLADALRQKLKVARRAWARQGQFNSFSEAVAVTVHDYADAVETASRDTNERLQAAAGHYGTEAVTSPRPRTLPEIGELAPEDRVARSREGKFTWIRRAVFGRWYLPGLEVLSGPRLEQEKAEQTGWVEDAAAAVRSSAAATLSSRLAQIREHADGEAGRIKAETNLTAHEAELAQLSRDLPVLTSETESIAQIAGEARSFS